MIPSTRSLKWFSLVALAAVLMTAGCGESKPPGPPPYEPEIMPLASAPPAGFDPVPIPPDNPMTAEKVALGRELFFDKRLSVDGSRSCYSCHLNEHGLTDGQPIAIGANNKKLTRSS